MKKMLRRLLIISLVLMMTCSSALACSAGDALQETLNNTLRAMVAAANASVKVQVRIAQETPYNDVDWLLASTQATVAPVFAYAKLIGATVECVYEYYWVDGEYVAIDPLKVINVRKTLDLYEDD